jgi:hypothetical protein
VPEVSHSKFMAQFGDFQLRLELACQWLNRLMIIDVSRTMLLHNWVPSLRLFKRTDFKFRVAAGC